MGRAAALSDINRQKARSLRPSIHIAAEDWIALAQERLAMTG
jgi:hypothetical protein